MATRVTQEYLDAYDEYAGRQSRKIRPLVSYDEKRANGKPRFYNVVLAQDEHMPCCDTYLSKPNIEAMFDHLRSIEHVAHLHGLDYLPFKYYCVQRRINETRAKRRKQI